MFGLFGGIYCESCFLFCSFAYIVLEWWLNTQVYLVSSVRAEQRRAACAIVVGRFWNLERLANLEWSICSSLLHVRPCEVIRATVLGAC